MNSFKGRIEWKYMLWILFAITFSTSSLVVVTRMTTEIFFVILAIVTCVLVFMRVPHKIKDDYVKIALLLSLIVLVNVVVNWDFSLINFAFVLLPWYGMVFYFSVERTKFVHYFCDCMVFLAVYSLIAHYIFQFFLPEIVSLFPIGKNSGGFPVHDFFLAFRYVSSVSRNTGIFREMGVYAVYLNFALYFLLFEEKEKKYKMIKMSVLFVTILSTLSTPGIIAMILLMGGYFWEILRSKRVKDWIFFARMFVLIFVIFAAILIFVPYGRDYILQAILKLTTLGSSFQGRVGVLVANLKVWFLHPFLGAGYAQSIELANNYYNYSEVMHNTGSNSSLLAMYGICYCLILYWYPVKLFVRKKISVIAKGACVFALLIIMECQYLILDSLFWIVVWYFIANSNEKTEMKEGQI